jgi:sulfate/thiosulfate transport system permease protein
MDTPAKRPSSERGAPPARKGWRRFSSRLRSSAGLYGGASLIVGYLSIIVLIPIAAVAAHGFSFSIHTQGWGAAFWHWHVSAGFGVSGTTSPARGDQCDPTLALALTERRGDQRRHGRGHRVGARARQFPGKWFIEAFIDLPFALPTIVVGVVLLFLYGPASPVKVDLFETWMGLMVALLFVTLPFSVRAVQPVLASLDGEAEAAAKSLGAGGIRTFVWVVLPSLWPAVLGGFGLAFARAIGEFGSISLIAGGLGRTTAASLHLQPDPGLPLDERRVGLDGAARPEPRDPDRDQRAFARRIQHRLAS